jgi:hypothetical protein
MLADFALRPAFAVHSDYSSRGRVTSGEQTPVGQSFRSVARLDSR